MFGMMGTAPRGRTDAIIAEVRLPREKSRASTSSPYTKALLSVAYLRADAL